MKKHIVFYSDLLPDQGFLSFLGIPPAPTKRPAELRAREEDAVLCGLGNLGALVYALIHYAYDGYKFENVLFFTHGSPGAISLGSDTLDADTLELKFKNRGYEQLFGVGATISFYGCDVAEGAKGEFFLIVAAETFLKRSGGKVIGNTGKAFAITANPPQPFGTQVTATISMDGKIKLTGHQHLEITRIESRIKNCESEISYLNSKSRSAFEKQILVDVEEMLKLAKALIEPLRGNPKDFYNLQDVCRYLDSIEGKIKVIKLTVHPPSVP